MRAILAVVSPLLAWVAPVFAPVLAPGSAWGMAHAFTLSGPGAPARDVTAADLGAMPQHRERVAFQTGHGEQAGDYAGVALWDVLAAALPPGPPKTRVRFAIYVTGSDGYTAAIAEGEIDPAFEGKSVLLGHLVNQAGASTGPWRLVVPGDRHGARAVQDVARIEVR